MREILFRGKTLKANDCCLDDNERGLWVYGSYTDEIGADCIGWYDELDKTWNIREVDPDTINEFTGQYDCEGNRIFEHDVVMMNGKFFVVVFSSKLACFYLYRKEEKNILDCDNRAKVRVIGNIHDKHEL